MLSFSATQVEEFRKEYYDSTKYRGLRVGQAFHQYFKLEKITGSEKVWCDRLYQKSGEDAWNTIMETVNHDQ